MKIRLSDRVACVGGGLTFVLLLATTTAHAAINISTQATQNMSCLVGVCTATAQKAYLNVNDVTNFLAAGDLKIVSGAGAEDIHIEAPFSWTSTSRLTLDAQRSIEFKKPVSVAGTGALTLVTNDGGSDGDYWFDEGASVSFWDTSSSLIINGQSFTLVKDIKTLAADIAANPSGNYALADYYDAGDDGTYVNSVVTTPLGGRFEGLGNTISDLSITSNVAYEFVGMFSEVKNGAVVKNVGLSNGTLTANANRIEAGLLIGQIDSGALLSASHATGIVAGKGFVGGLVGGNLGTILRCSADVNVTLEGHHAYDGGGLVGANEATVIQSYATGLVRGHGESSVGGLVGNNDGFVGNGTIVQSYSTGDVSRSNYYTGGLAGEDIGAHFSEVYALGLVSGRGYGHAGLVGSDLEGVFEKAYWDTTTTGQSTACNGTGVGDECDATGLTDTQLKSALPDGFDPKVWGQDANINNGYPYLLANPPPKNAPGKARLKSSRHSAHYAPHA
ncbi:MAG TPA: hypothetical protein VLC74_03050 [Rhizomicrobium sp.]|nr:hypothetical protein [Rhizomicrobium sp.]